MRAYSILITISLAAAALTGYTTPKPVALAPVGPNPGATRDAADKGALQVYTARLRAVTDVNAEEFFWNNDFGRNDFLYAPGHTDYTIYNTEGTVVERVRNARQGSAPAVVRLAPGAYKLTAQAENGPGMTIPVTVEVTIAAGQNTVVNLEQRPVITGEHDRRNLVYLPNGTIAGWASR